VGWVRGPGMELVAFYQGWYGERIIKHLQEQAPDWAIWAIKLRKGLPSLPDEETDLLAQEVMKKLPREAVGADLALFLHEEPGASLLMPEVARRAEVRALICPADDYRVLPRGLELQLSEELMSVGLLFSFPRPFCSLSRGPGPIGDFAERFGRPELIVELDGHEIRSVRVLRGAPCGSTHYMARRLVGTRVEEAPSLAGLYVQTYPCLASHVEDPVLGEDMIHLSATLAKLAVERAILKASGGG